MRRTEQLWQWRSGCERRALVVVADDGGGAEDRRSRGGGGGRGRQCNPAAGLAGSRTRGSSWRLAALGNQDEGTTLLLGAEDDGCRRGVSLLKEEGGDRVRGALREDGALREGEGEIERGGSSRALPGSMHACVGGGGGEREGLRGREARVRRVRWAGAGWLGPRGRLGCKVALSLSLPHILLIEKKLERRKEKRG